MDLFFIFATNNLFLLCENLGYCTATFFSFLSKTTLEILMLPVGAMPLKAILALSTMERMMFVFTVNRIEKFRTYTQLIQLLNCI